MIKKGAFCISLSLRTQLFSNMCSGFSGLYRGIASNIASSAPISALYTFTYESVKGSLLPLFPKVSFTFQ